MQTSIDTTDVPMLSRSASRDDGLVITSPKRDHSIRVAIATIGRMMNTAPKTAGT